MPPRKSGSLCCVIGCPNSRSNSPGTKFYRFPKVGYKIEQKIKWIQAIQQRIDMASYSPDFLKEFFSIFKNYPCMWDTTSVEYQDLARKHEAMTALLAKFREIHAEATQDFVEQKIVALTTFYRKQREKLRRALSRGGTRSNLQEQWYFGEDWSFFDLPAKLKPMKKIARPNTSALIEEEMYTKEPIVASWNRVNLVTAQNQISFPSTWSAQSNIKSDHVIIKEEVEIEFKQENPDTIEDDVSAEDMYPMDTENPNMDPLDVPTSSPSTACTTSEQPAPSATAGIVIAKEENLEASPTQISAFRPNISAVPGYSEESSTAPSGISFANSNVRPAAVAPQKIQILNKNIRATNASTLKGPIARQKDTCSTFGEYVDVNLSNVRPDQIILAERFINDVLYTAQIGVLDDSWTFLRLPSSGTVYNN